MNSNMRKGSSGYRTSMTALQMGAALGPGVALRSGIATQTRSCRVTELQNTGDALHWYALHSNGGKTALLALYRHMRGAEDRKYMQPHD